jgi:hypothetical protein
MLATVSRVIIASGVTTANLGRPMSCPKGFIEHWRLNQHDGPERGFVAD